MAHFTYYPGYLTYHYNFLYKCYKSFMLFFFVAPINLSLQRVVLPLLVVFPRPPAGIISTLIINMLFLHQSTVSLKDQRPCSVQPTGTSHSQRLNVCHAAADNTTLPYCLHSNLNICTCGVRNSLVFAYAACGFNTYVEPITYADLGVECLKDRVVKEEVT